MICFCFHLVHGQKNKELTFTFKPLIAANDLLLSDTIYLFDKANTMKIETLKYYISHVQLFEDGKLVFTEKNSYHLYDISDSTHHSFKLNIPSALKFNILRFNLGIDSITTVSGAMGGDLDPTKGMYWTWQSGYINFKIEGTSNLCSNPKKEFQFHLGGYQAPFNTLQYVSLKVSSTDNIEIKLDVHQFMKNIDLAKQDHLMSPNKEAVLLSELLIKCFSTN